MRPILLLALTLSAACGVSDVPPTPEMIAERDDGERSALQKHVDFFDGDQSGYITVSETADGFGRLGFGYMSSYGFATAIHVGLSHVSDSWYDPLTLNISRMHEGKHDNDTDIFDEAGEFVPERFDRVFPDYDLDGDGAWSEFELDSLYDGQYETTSGFIASKAEFGVLFQVASEPREIDGQLQSVVTEESLRSLYDGTLFYELAGESVPF